MTFLLNDEYEQMQHVFGAISKFLRVNGSRLRNRELTTDNGQTRVRFQLVDAGVDDSVAPGTPTLATTPSNSQLITDLRDIVESDKFTIIDLSIHKTVRAVKGSLKCGPRGEPVSGVSMAKTSAASEPGARFAIEFNPTCVGRYRIDLTDSSDKRDRQLAPYFINVYDPNAFQFTRRPSSFIIGTENIIEGILCGRYTNLFGASNCDFIKVDLAKCGFGNLETIIESPDGVRLPFKIDNNFSKKIRFIPTVGGVHKLTMIMGDTILTGLYIF